MTSLCKFSFSRLLVIALTTIAPVSALAQNMPSDPSVDTGTHWYGSYDGVHENIGLSSGNLSFCIPLVSVKGPNKHDLSIPLCYNSNFQEPTISHQNLSVIEVVSYFPWAWAPNTPSGFTTPRIGAGWTLTGAPAYYASNVTTGGYPVEFMPDGSRFSFTPNVYAQPDAQNADTWLTNTGISQTLIMKDGTKYLVSGEGSSSCPPGGCAEELFPDGTTFNWTNTSVTDAIGRVVTESSGSTFSGSNTTSSTAYVQFQYPDPVSTGSTQKVVVQMQTMQFDCTPGDNIGPYGETGSVGLYSMPTAIILANGLTYTFQYDNCGALRKVTYPTGGYTRYDYSAQQLTYHCLGCNAGPFAYYVNEVSAKHVCPVPAMTLGSTTASAFNSSNQCPVAEETTTYTPTVYGYNQFDGTAGGNQQMIVADPVGNSVVYQFSQGGLPMPDYTAPSVETSRQYYDASGKLWKTISTQYTSGLTTSTAPGSTFNQTGPGTGDTPPVLPTIQTTTLDNGMVSQVQWSYDIWQADLNDSVLTEERIYDYAQGAPGPLLKRTDYTWLHRVNPSSYGWPNGNGSGGNHICDRKTSETVYDGSGKKLEQTTYTYDANNGGGPALLTSVTKWRSTDGASLTTSYTYTNYYGNVATMTDPKGNVTQYSYADNYADGTNRNSNAFLTETTDALGHVTQNQYYWGGSQVAATCGENFSGSCVAGLSSGADYASYTYDLMGRKTSTTTGDGGKTTTCYSDQGGSGCSAQGYPLQTTTTEAISSTVSKVSTSIAMHPISGLPGETTQLNSDPSCPGGTVNVDTTYDLDGRKSTVTNPYCSTNPSAPTSGTTTYAYDGLSRITQVTHPDGAYATNTYTGRAVLSADEGNGTHRIQRISQTDALGRLIYVCEVTGQTQQGSSNNMPSSCGAPPTFDISATGFLTTYGYDASNSNGPLDSLTNVTQGGVTRSFIFDSLGELRSASNPESGTTAYTYDNDGNLTSKTDAKNIVTSYSYDALNRLLSKTYSDGTTPSACFQYDQTSVISGVGRLTTEWTQTGTCPSAPPSSGVLTQRGAASYDPLGRITTAKQCKVLGNCTSSTLYSLTYRYDLAGDVTSFNNGLLTSSLSFSGQYNSAGRLSTLSGPTSGGSFQSTPLFVATGYTPAGALANAQIGIGANDQGITFHRDYNSRLLPIDEQDTVGTTPGTATVQITGSEQSVGGGSAQYPNVLTFAGSDSNGQTGMYTIAVYAVAGGPPVALVNVSWNSSSTPSSLATALGGSMLSCMTSTTYGVGVVGSSVYVANCRPGNQYYFVPSLDYYSTGSGPDFTATTNASGGGTYDTGTASLSVNGTQIAMANYGSGSTPSSIASALASNGANNGLVTFVVNGANLTMNAIGGGTITDYSYQIQISTSQPTIFTSPSFSASPTSGSLVGGSNAPLYNWAISNYAPNGDVLAMTDSVMGGWSYAYDDFNRLTGGSATAGVDNGLTLGWTYDRYGNRWAQNANCSSGNCGGVSAAQPQLSFANSNQVVGWSYDADGNLLNDGRNSYTYDAEGRVVTLNGAQTYMYDAEGRRVAKYSGGSISSIYLLGLGGEQVTELTSSGGWKHSNLFAPGGRLVASYEGPNGTAAAGYHFHLTDWLGTERMQTTAAGAQEETCASYPFGDGLNCTGTSADATEQHFTGKERDAESGLDYFFARYYSSNLARFMTPDWAAAPTAVPYATFGDPQTLNLYAYVNNNPNTGVDLDGHLDGGGGPASFDGFGNDLPSGYFQFVDNGKPNQGAGNSGNNANNQSGNTSDSGQGSGSKTPGTPARPAPPNPNPKNPVKKQAQPGQSATSTKKSTGDTTPPHGGNNQPKPPEQHDCTAEAKNVAVDTVKENFGLDFAGTAAVTAAAMFKTGATVTKVAKATGEGILYTAIWTVFKAGVSSYGTYMGCSASQLDANIHYMIDDINYNSHP